MPARFSNEYIRQYVIDEFKKNSYVDGDDAYSSLHTGEEPTTFLTIRYEGRRRLYDVFLYNRSGVLKWLVSTQGIDSSSWLLEHTLNTVDGVVDSFYEDIDGMRELGFELMLDEGDRFFRVNEGATMYRLLSNGDVIYCLTDYDDRIDETFIEVGIKPESIKERTNTYEQDRVRYPGSVSRVEAIRRFVSLDWDKYIKFDRSPLIDRGTLLTSIPFDMRDKLIRMGK